MAYWLNLFSPETWQAFQEHGAEVSGFRESQMTRARGHIKPGDIFICYLVRLSRWCGALQVESEVFYDDTPIFLDPDPYVTRFKVKPIAMLTPESSLPILHDDIWKNLNCVSGVEKGARGWAGIFQGSLREIDEADGTFLLDALLKQVEAPTSYPLTERDKRQLARKSTIKTLDGTVTVEVPDDDDDDQDEEISRTQDVEVRQSIRIQAKIAEIGAEMGFRIWIPRNDRSRISEEVGERCRAAFLSDLPLNYDDTTLRTIENIDVIWLKGRSMARAFEVEHTTAIYSGILRMADLLALQPNMNIRLHIVAPLEKADRVRREIARPVFSLLEQGPLYKKCTYLPYDAIEELSKNEHLKYLSDGILGEFEIYADQ